MKITIALNLLIFSAILLSLSYFYYSTKVKKVKTGIKPKVAYKNSLNSDLTKTMLLTSNSEREKISLEKEVDKEVGKIKEIIDLNKTVESEIDRIESNQRNLKLIKFDKNKFSKF